jgi:hypothetical protein
VSAVLPSVRQVEDLLADLEVERSKLQGLVASLGQLQQAWPEPIGAQDRCDATALRLQSFYTGIERCFVQIVRVLNGGPPEGADWHRRLLERMGVASDVRPVVLAAATVRRLGEFLRFRHVVRHLYAYELEPEQVERLLSHALDLWPTVDREFVAFESWLRELTADRL